VLRLRGAKVERIVEGEGKVADELDPVLSDDMPLLFPLSRLAADTVRVNASMKSTATLWEEVQSSKDSVTGSEMKPEERSLSLTELNKRYSFSLACITFALVGIPLGVTAQRRDTSMGFVLSLVTATVYIGMIILADGVNDKPHYHPHLIMWLPNVLFLGIGGWLFWRLSRK
jgi:lipopolysaccharide export system permease protein